MVSGGHVESEPEPRHPPDPLWDHRGCREGRRLDLKEHLNGELTEEQKIALAERLRGDMAGLKMDAWESVKRADIPPGYWEKFVAKRLAEWPCYTIEVIRQREFDLKGVVSDREAFSHLRHISIAPHNAFLARMRYTYMQKLKNQS